MVLGMDGRRPQRLTTGDKRIEQTPMIDCHALATARVRTATRAEAIWYRLARWNGRVCVPRHVLTMIGVVFVFFALLWLAVVVMGQSPGEAMLLSFITLFLVGIGVTFTVASARGDRPNHE